MLSAGHSFTKPEQDRLTGRVSSIEARDGCGRAATLGRPVAGIATRTMNNPAMPGVHSVTKDRAMKSRNRFFAKSHRSNQARKPARAKAPVFETLEGRQLMSAT